MWAHMGWPARAIAIILLGMSAWSIGVMMDRWLAFSAARKQSRQFAPVVAGALREGKLDEAIRISERNKKSHLAKVVNAGLHEFRAHDPSQEISEKKIDASRRALNRSAAIVHAELERGLSGLATIGSTAPFVGLLGTVIGLIKTFSLMQSEGLYAHVADLSTGVWKALICAAAGLAVAIPAHAAYNYLVSRVNSIVLDMERAATEVVNIVTEGAKP